MEPVINTSGLKMSAFPLRTIGCDGKGGGGGFDIGWGGIGRAGAGGSTDSLAVDGERGVDIEVWALAGGHDVLWGGGEFKFENCEELCMD